MAAVAAAAAAPIIATWETLTISAMKAIGFSPQGTDPGVVVIPLSSLDHISPQVPSHSWLYRVPKGMMGCKLFPD